MEWKKCLTRKQSAASMKRGHNLKLPSENRKKRIAFKISMQARKIYSVGRRNATAKIVALIRTAEDEIRFGEP